MAESDNSGDERPSMESYKFSSDELRVLRECNSESFFKRSFPLSAGLGLTTYFAVQKGILQPNATYGSIPKVFASVLVGYFAGKLSYQRKCVEKIMQLPNSKLAEMLRFRNGRIAGNTMISDQSKPDMPPTRVTPNQIDVYGDDYASSSIPSFDVGLENRAETLDLGDIYHPYLDDDSSQLESDVNTGISKDEDTYAGFRKKNRDEYKKIHATQKNQASYEKIKSFPDDVNSSIKNELGSKPTISKNKYGDSWNN